MIKIGVMKMIKFLKPEKIDLVISQFFSDYFEKAKYTKAFVAISGGIDSATIAYLSTKILGGDNVIAAFFPSSITSNESREFYNLVIDMLNIKNHYEISIDKFMKPYLESDESLNENNPKSKLRKGNIMARIRMILSYDIAAKHDALVVGTENKTEFLLGYSTQWGDSAAALHPMGDIYKTEVFNYARFLGVPEKIVNRIPTAELWDNQTDEQEIGLKYRNIDEILIYLFEQRLSKDEIIKLGYKKEEIERVENLVNRSEYKRRLPQAALFEEFRI